MSSKLEQMIDEIEDYINGCNYVPLSNTKIIVNKEEIEELLSELRDRTPEEIKRYQKIISNKEEILNAAKDQADKLLARTTQVSNEMVSQHEIMQQAYAQADQIVKLATQQAQDTVDGAIVEANQIRAAAMEYIDKAMGELESIVTYAIKSSSAQFEKTISTLKSSEETIKRDRMELHPSQAPAEPEEAAELPQDESVNPM